MAEILGAVAAVSQLTGGLVKLTTDMRRYMKAIRKTPEDVQSFLLETSNFTGLLNHFTDLVDHSSKDLGNKERKKRDQRICQIKEQCNYVYDEIEVLVARFAKLADGGLTTIESWIKRIIWILDTPDVKALRFSLMIAMITVNSASTLYMWEEAIAKNDNLRRYIFSATFPWRT
jgi:hypothetical protein